MDEPIDDVTGGVRCVRDVVEDVAPAPLTPLSRTVGAASVLLGPVPGAGGAAVAVHSGHLFVECTDPPDPLAGSEPPRLPDPAAEAAADGRVAEARQARPDLATATPSDLVARLLALRDDLAVVVPAQAQAEIGLRLATAAVARATGSAAGTATLLAAYARGEEIDAVWELGRVVSGSAPLTTLFDDGVHGLYRRLAASRLAPVRAFHQGLETVLVELAHVGPGGWELLDLTWRMAPDHLLRLLDVLRRAGDGRRPGPRHLPSPRERAAARGRRPGLQRALTAVVQWQRARDRAADRVGLVTHEQRLAAHELGRRAVAQGVLDDAADVFALAADELAAFVADPGPFAEPLRFRGYDHRALATFRPPAETAGPPPPVVRWPRVGSGSPLPAGAALAGRPAGAGRAEGPAAVLCTPAELDRLVPGAVLVAGTAGECWVPLLPGAVALVVDGGSVTSPAAAACRRLGIPCLIATRDATECLPHGAAVAVDAEAGRVRVVGGPTGGTTLTRSEQA